MRQQPFNPAKDSIFISMRGMPLETFIGYRLVCERCRNPFRCYRADETHCGGCHHMKDQ